MFRESRPPGAEPPRLLASRFEETCDVSERHFDLGEIGLENGRELMESLEQQFLVLRKTALFVPVASEALANGVVRHYRSSFLSKAINPIYGDFEVNNSLPLLGTPSQTHHDGIERGASGPVA